MPKPDFEIPPHCFLRGFDVISTDRAALLAAAVRVDELELELPVRIRLCFEPACPRAAGRAIVVVAKIVPAEGPFSVDQLPLRGSESFGGGRLDGLPDLKAPIAQL